MIVVDCNVLAYLVLPGDRTTIAKQAFEQDSHWSAPALWRSEFLSVLALYIRTGMFTLAAAEEYMKLAEEIITVLPASQAAEVLARSAESGCSSYDCEYVAAAEVQRLKLLTEDQKVLAAFPDVARSLAQFITPSASAGSST